MKREKKAGRQCSRSLPDPLRIYSVVARKDKLKWKLYPGLEAFKQACKKCRHRRSARGNGSECVIKDPDFKLKFYSIGDKQTWVGTVPPALARRNPPLYLEAVEFVRGRARSFRERASSGSQEINVPRERTRLDLADGTDVSLCRHESKPVRFERVGKRSDPEGSLKIQAL